MITCNYEHEVKISMNQHDFIRLLEWNGEEFGGWEARFSLSRKTIFLDTSDYYFLSKNQSLALVLHAGFTSKREDKFVFKEKYNDTIKKELVLQFPYNCHQNKYYTNLEEILKEANCNVCQSEIFPRVIINQKRHKRGLTIHDKKLFLSFDEVEYLREDLFVLDKIYIVELETSSEAPSSLLHESDFEFVTNYIIKNFNGIRTNKSKYAYGVELLKETEWDTTKIFKSDKEWDDCFNTLKNELISVIKQGNTEVLHLKKEEYLVMIERLVLYSNLKHYLNLSCDHSRKRFNMALALKNEISKIINPKPSEEIKISESAQIAKILFYEIYERDISFEDITDSKGEIIQLTKANYSSFLRNSDRTLRRNAFRSLYKSYGNYKNTLARCLDIFVSSINTVPLSESIKDKNERDKFIGYFLKINDANLWLLSEYMKNRKKKMDLNDFYIYDIQSIIRDEEEYISRQYAKEIVLESLKPLGSDYVNKSKMLLSEGYIDYYPRKNKKSGAFTITGGYLKEPYISIQYQGHIQSVISIAHELGHGVASLYLPNSNYNSLPTLIAEIHASVNESLVISYLKKIGLPGINDYYLEKFRANYYRQMLLSEFEIKMYQIKKKYGTLTEKILCEEYKQFVKKYYGEEVILENGIELEWAKIPYFYTPFSLINYPLAFIFGEYISQRIEESKIDHHTYISFLSATQDNIRSLLSLIDIDIFDENVYSSFFKKFSNLLNEFKIEKTMERGNIVV